MKIIFKNIIYLSLSINDVAGRFTNKVQNILSCGLHSNRNKMVCLLSGRNRLIMLLLSHNVLFW